MECRLLHTTLQHSETGWMYMHVLRCNSSSTVLLAAVAAEAVTGRDQALSCTI
jgi:hypothetical protein